MREKEEQTIKRIQALNEASRYDLIKIENLFHELSQEPFGNTSRDFINQRLLITLVLQKTRYKNYFILWLRIETYLKDKTKESLDSVKATLKEYLEEEASSERRSRGTAMLPLEIANAQFMRKLYSAFSRL